MLVPLASLLALAPVAVAQVPSELARLVDPAGGAGDDFGTATAIDGDLLLVGAPGSDAAGAVDAGEVQVFERQPGGSWALLSTLDAGTAAPLRFGTSLALTPTHLFVGAPASSDPLASGAVHVYRRNGSTFLPQQVLSSGSVGSDWYGTALDADGSALVVGAPRLDVPYADAGQVFAYESIAGGPFELTDQLSDASFLTFPGLFGFDVDLHGDRMVVGWPQGQVAGSGQPQNSGAAVIFERSPDGTWDTVNTVGPSGVTLNLAGIPVGAGFGAHVALDGDWAFASATYDDDSDGWGSGAVYAFRRQADGTWSEWQKLLGSGVVQYDSFGSDLAAGGGRLVVGTTATAFITSSGNSTLRLFELGGAGLWMESVAFDSAVDQAFDDLGWPGSLAVDGDRLAAGAPRDAAQGSAAGAVYAFDLLPLGADKGGVSAATGGVQSLEVAAGQPLAGQLYLVLGSASGTGPGVPLDGGLTLPLAADGYTAYTIADANSGPLGSTFGAVPADGVAAATITIPAGATSLIGATLHHAFLTLDVTAGTITSASNAVGLVVQP